MPFHKHALLIFTDPSPYKSNQPKLGHSVLYARVYVLTDKFLSDYKLQPVSKYEQVPIIFNRNHYIIHGELKDLWRTSDTIIFQRYNVFCHPLSCMNDLFEFCVLNNPLCYE